MSVDLVTEASEKMQIEGTLLVVDDEVEIREIIELYASTLGMTVYEASDGDAALEILRSRQVDVVVSDLMMPRMTGLGLLEKLREGGFSQPFIFVTAYPSQDSTIQALRLGAFDYLEKPFDPEELGALLREAMRVSRELKKIPDLPLTGAMGTENQGLAAREIHKLRTLRFDRHEIRPKEDTKAQKIFDLFVNEATPQLLFCEAAIRALGKPEERAFELGYLFRVMQGVGAAAAAIDATSIKEVAGRAAHFYTALRVKPRAYSEEHAELATRANSLLRTLVAEVGGATENASVDAAMLAELIQALEAAALTVEHFTMHAVS